MPPTVRYHCPCFTSHALLPPPHLASSSHHFHPLHELFFCEECDAIRCNRCVSVEVSGYYCPNCLFEVPSASVRAEKNRYAISYLHILRLHSTLLDAHAIASCVLYAGIPFRSCHLTHPTWTMGVYLLISLASRPSSSIAITVGGTLQKSISLSRSQLVLLVSLIYSNTPSSNCPPAQLQKYEDSAPDSLEFERLKEHFEPFIRASSSSALPPTASHSHHTHVNPITAAASSALARDIPGVVKYTPHHAPRSARSGRDKSTRDEMSEYRSRVEVGAGTRVSGAGGEADVEFMQHIESIGEVASLEQRWVNSWATSLHTRYVPPLSSPLAPSADHWGVPAPTAT